MNHPLSYNGETFYQQAFLPLDWGTRLQVVRNPGWIMPYLSCAMVSFGMLIHFGLHLSKFLRIRMNELRAANGRQAELATGLAGQRRRT